MERAQETQGKRERAMPFVASIGGAFLLIIGAGVLSLTAAR
ncbi:hypothetical protein [Aureimonas phyllosphaerae]|uniref:Uncharacterized protein n=1 Tax=Aureimonas phyllosphaerae TaxID=1166078 RepID=A0A7W6FTG5_9HYPH|nr:hypothetical protein [Aureimonas phyllosphaerae]MBB3934695.1 hypothetical protein [Aureimonas phyllosphaerae]